ncbi:MAG: Nif3-like dinuclear metal center hexameric protein [Armatimonadota bacterium]
MPITVREVLGILNRIAPPQWACRDDPVGLQVGDPNQAVERVLVALDPDPKTVTHAHYRHCQLLITHHPLIFRPLRTVRSDDPLGQAVQLLCAHQIAHIAVHTNWDVAPGGINDALAKAVGLESVRPFGEGTAVPQYKLVVFVPTDYLDTVLDAMASAGAGVIGLYRRCAFYHPGTETYEPMEGANPFQGSVGQREHVDEMRLEILVPDDKLEGVIQAIEHAHPYEEVAYDVYPLRTSQAYALGRVGRLPCPMLASELRDYLADKLGNPYVRLYGKPNGTVRTLAVVGGAGGDSLASAKNAFADALLTGEVRHHHTWEAWARDLVLFEGGHAETETPGVHALAERLHAELEPYGVEIFTTGGPHEPLLRADCGR